MNDKTIINTISKIHFIIVSALSFILLFLFTLFIFLQDGIFLHNISFANINIEKLYIKWDKKITLYTKEIIIKEQKNQDITIDDIQKILSSLKVNLTFLNLFKEITIDRISFGQMDIALNYDISKDGFLKISSPDIELYATLTSKGAIFHLDIEKFYLIDKDVNIDGDVIFNSQDKLELTTSLAINIKNSTILRLYANSNRYKLRYKVESDKPIKNLKQITTLFDIDERVKYWVDDAIKLSSLEINSFHGWFEYKKMKEAYLNIYAKAVAHDLTYTYDTQVAPIRTKATNLEFKDGVLFIRPKEAYSYDFFLDKSWLKIDFSKKEELLTLYLLFEGSANKDLLHLLSRYGIDLPFIQNRGSINANLKLDINLISTDVEAIGNLYAKESQINYLDLDIDVYEANISIRNSYVEVKNMRAKYENIASAYVDLSFNGKDSSGKLVFKFDSIELKDNNFSLVNGVKPLLATYYISPKQDYLEIDESKYNYNNQSIKMDALNIPFDIKNLTAKIPTTKIELSQLASIVVFGDIFLKTKHADFGVIVNKLNLFGISLGNKTPKLKILHDNGITSISSKGPINLTLDKQIINLKNISVDISKESLNFKNIALDFKDVLKSNISAKYDFKNSIGVIDMSDTTIQNSAFGEIFKNKKNTQLILQNKNNKIYLSSKEYKLDYILSDNSWLFRLNSLDNIAKSSKLLEKYSLSDGELRVEKSKDNDNILFNLDLNYAHKFLVDENIPIEKYLINGKYNTKNSQTLLNINNLVDIKVKDSIDIKADNIGVDIGEIINIISDENSTKESKKETLPVYVNTTNSYIYLSENRKLISENMSLKYINNVLSAELKHKDAKATFILKDDILSLYGKNFNDEFMEKLFSLSKFKGGTMEFYINGPIDSYSGTVSVTDTIIVDYKILNNILAFVNTVPSLATFSLPGYSQKGIKTKNAYINFKLEDDVYKISDIYLKSQEIEIVGLGEASIKQNSINLDLNLITQLGSSLSKIPLLGHILLGDKSVSTTLTVTGALDNPDVNTQLAKDIAVAPYNIIKRTLMYPLGLFKDSEDKE
ncbi:MAG TPA: AsmA-like C-terminal domain-containing protein [Sulfurimonas sp.]|uniref:YhdP family protein n=1 Tax=Sulfurimonas sp. TaxID=2022749 RepID=UPI002BE57B5A|nr:AsmA-like C-terminal domain-containing protein [Sulfurimonas sp.]HUH41698.1 AsmA-like C-terminal domain-containing protein [Sulfurimonas sp.]